MSYVHNSFLSQDIWSGKPMCVDILYFFQTGIEILVKGGATYAMR